MRIAIIGAGWAGLAAAVQATRDGHDVTVFEASRTLGGRARKLMCRLPDGTDATLDNGQHILIGAYHETLSLMRQVGVNPDDALLRVPLNMTFADGDGLRFPDWPAPLDALAAILGARGWRFADKASMLRAALGWQMGSFSCAPSLSVAALCKSVRPAVMAGLIEPLCVSALNTPADRASAQVFLRVMHDSVFGPRGSSSLLLPRVDLSTLFPDAAARWLDQHGARLRLGTRAQSIQFAPPGAADRWLVNGQVFDTILLATSASNALLALEECASTATNKVADQINRWVATASGVRFEAIATVYAWRPDASLPQPMLTLRSGPDAPAQFVFDRGQLGGPPGLLAFVVSASTGSREAIQAKVLAQARDQLDLDLTAVQTVVEKRATFACTPGLARPSLQIAPGLMACGDYVAGPYPATLEGAVRNGLAAARAANVSMEGSA